MHIIQPTVHNVKKTTDICISLKATYLPRAVQSEFIPSVRSGPKNCIATHCQLVLMAVATQVTRQSTSVMKVGTHMHIKAFNEITICTKFLSYKISEQYSFILLVVSCTNATNSIILIVPSSFKEIV